MKNILTLIIITVFFSCVEGNKPIKESENPSQSKSDTISSKIPVLNFATFHMGKTSDANSTEFDENDRKNQQDAKRIAEMISKFKPTIICVEYPTEKDSILQNEYKKFLKNPSEPVSWYGEIGLVAFPLAQMNGLKKIYGIDHKMSYNYRIAREIENEIDSITVNNYYENPFKDHPEIDADMDSLNLLEKLKLMNHPKFLDFLIVVNADILAYAGTEGNFEGADEAAKYYQRNLRIYSNLNRIPMTNDDRVFILSGGSHTAFLREFFERSPKYEMVDTFQYLD
ncbi:DUF5694 domain-containing protein [Aquimarina sp. U1-2]|uniref:DUF5694 domain-containing protein n=1 Tax=Aquimarina sp. U1-2 TaxID=2823141 RepID=UPI001FEE0004|nr:DUF5694 domain-containing protein [Aquimarina sp. U1-2]